GEDTARSGSEFFALHFAGTVAAEPPVCEAAGALHQIDELCLGHAADRCRFAPVLRGGVEGLLDLVEGVGDRTDDAGERRGSLAAGATREDRLSSREVTGPDLEPHRHAESLTLEVLGPGLHVVA